MQFRADVMNAEDTLKRLINDPQLNQAADIEIIPTETPAITPIVVDQLGELTAALENRSELREAKYTIQQAQIGSGWPKTSASAAGPGVPLHHRRAWDQPGRGLQADEQQ